MQQTIVHNENHCLRCYDLAAKGDLDGLLRAREAGCPWNKETGPLNHSEICVIPAMTGDLVTLKWLWTQGCPEPCWRSVMKLAAARGHWEVVSWAYARRLPTGANYCQRCYDLAGQGDLEGLLQAREGGCRWNQEVGFLNHCDLCLPPAKEGDLVTLQWLWSQGCPGPYWQRVIGMAAAWGRSEVVSWACAQGLPMDESAAWVASADGHLGILQDLLAAGCPWDPEKCLLAANVFDQPEVAAWIEWSVSPVEVKEPDGV